MPAHIREMFDTAVHAHEDPHRTVETAMREMEGAEKARDAVVIDEQNLERENGGLWQFYSTDLSELTVPLGPFRCQARKRQRVDLIVLPLRVETRAILAKEAIGILRRCVSWVTIMSPNASRSYRVPSPHCWRWKASSIPRSTFHPLHRAKPLTRVTPNRVTLFFAAARRGQPFQRLSFGPQ